uniref:C-type lectin domain-containing protein n=1 Tax=Acrobeloides nanus TaxID=290746 RepID=A0A914DGP1_9BILA
MMFFHLLALVLTYCSYAYGDCPSGAIQGNNPDECYIVVDTATTWQTAEESCQALGGHLTSIVNAYQNSFLLSKINVILSRYYYAWIGANTLTYPGTWTWTDNSSWIYSNWASGYPYGSNNLCGAMGTTSGRWYSFNCANDIHPYVCGVVVTNKDKVYNFSMTAI